MAVCQASGQAARLLTAVILSALLAACATPQTPAVRALPENCRTGCVTPYGELLGVAAGHTPAYSNCSAHCVVMDPNRRDGTYTGIKWQCVEFARRWLLDNHGVAFGDVDVAADIWNKIRFVTRLSDGRHIPLETQINGSAQPPRAGDLLVYAREYLSTGHVAVITEVNREKGFVAIAEQNFLNDRWPGDYARRVPLSEVAGRYWVLDGYLLGWKRVSADAVAAR